MHDHPALTEKNIKAALAAGVPTRRTLWSGEIPGFGLKLLPTGATTWVLLYRPKGAGWGTPSRTLKIGNWPAVGVEDAKAAARQHHDNIAQGADPARDRREQREQRKHLLQQDAQPTGKRIEPVRGALTERQIKAAQAAGTLRRYVLWDRTITGLGLRIFPGGTTSWVFVYRPKGSRRGTPASTLTIGKWPAITIHAARIAAQAYAGKIAIGIDPAAELREKRMGTRRLLSHALDEFEASLARRRIVNVKPTLSALRRGLAPYLAREVETLTRAMIVSRIEALEAEGKPGAAGDLRRASRTFLEWCLTKGLVANNVLAGLRRPAISRADRLEDEERKGRALNDTETAALWLAAGGLGAFGGLVRLAMLSGMRRGELAGLTWDAVLDDRIVLHASGTKTGARHEIPLTALMRNVLQAQPRTTSSLVFPSTRHQGKAQLTGWTNLVESAVDASGVSFRLHDLRRSFRTLLSRLGVTEAVAEAAIGHVKGGLIAAYDRHDWWNERIAAFTKTSEHVAALLEEGDGMQETANVVPLRVR